MSINLKADQDKDLGRGLNMMDLRKRVCMRTNGLAIGSVFVENIILLPAVSVGSVMFVKQVLDRINILMIGNA